jgi:hypothetical protein
MTRSLDEAGWRLGENRGDGTCDVICSLLVKVGLRRSGDQTVRRNAQGEPLRLEFLLMANDAAIFALGTVSHRARRFAPCSWRLSVQLVVSLFIPTLQRLLALLSNVCKIVFLFYAVPFCLDAVWRIFHDKDENREE